MSGSTVEKEKVKWHGGDDVGALVFDIGSASARVGYAGDDTPKQVWDSIVGLPTSVASKASVRNYVFPLNLYRKTDNMDVSPAFFHTGGDMGFDCNAYERIVEQCCSRKCGLGVDLVGKPVLLSEPSRHYKALRSKMVQLMFETFGVEAVYVVKSAVLSTFAVGKSAACIVDIGALGTSITPVQDGYTLQRSMSEYKVGGNLIDSELGLLLGERGLFVTPKFAVHKNVGIDLGANKDAPTLFSPVDCSSVTTSYMEYAKRLVIRDMKYAVCRVCEDSKAAELAAKALDRRDAHERSEYDHSGPYELPDGTSVQFSEELGARGAEILFTPSCSLVGAQTEKPLEGFSGIPQAIHACIASSDVDLRKELLSSIVLTGGTTLMPGLAERVQKELQEGEGMFGNTLKFKIVSPSAKFERQFSAWIGGSILASLGTFQQMWMSRYEYKEHGAELVERKCMQ
eukprot:GHVN01000630.1.p1 GENE.GHVN01000630.1~~GHVN01000630.1.p1  ORF type:complete len:456 (+),score=39.77 GHVN01000630.1:4940-6307(+)